MVRFIYGRDLPLYPYLQKTMFTDRAEQFSQRLKWQVKVNENGWERDQYDRDEAIYLIAQDDLGRHEGSLRLLPTTSSTMLNDHFGHCFDGPPINNERIWECTRFCIRPNGGIKVAARLLAAAGKLMQERDLEHYVGVFDAKMIRLYRLMGASPITISTSNGNSEGIAVGLWSFSKQQYSELLKRGGISSAEMELYFVNSDLSDMYQASVAA